MFLPKGGEQVWLADRPTVVRMQDSDAARTYRLQAHAEGTEARVLYRPQLMVLPKISGTTVIRAVPPAGCESFASQTTVSLVVGPDGTDPEADYLQMSVEVSGLRQLDVLQLEPLSGRLRATVLGRAEDKPLPPHAELARDITRALLNRPFVAAEEAVDLVVAVDCSPSMRWYVESGALEALLEVFAGVASVIDPNRVVEAELCGTVVTSAGAYGIEEFARRFVERVRAAPRLTGCRAAALADRADAERVTYLISDAVPADLAQRRSRPHVVVLADPGFLHGGGGYLGSPDTIVPVALPGAGLATRSSWWERHELVPVVASLISAHRYLREDHR